MKKLSTSTLLLVLLTGCALSESEPSIPEGLTGNTDVEEVEFEERLPENEEKKEALDETSEQEEAIYKGVPEEETEEKDERVDPNVETIQSFYRHIEEHEFQKAYDLYSVKKVGLETFRSWYKDVVDVEVTEIEIQGKNTYIFTVFLTESNGTTGTFRVTMEVGDGKLETKSSENIRSNEETCHEDVCASLYTNYDRYCIMLSLPSTKAPKMLGCSDPGATFGNLRFSPRGQYIIYDKEFDTPHGQHIVNTFLYNVATLARLNTLLENVTYVDIVLDDTKVVACGVPGDSDTGYVRIYSLPSAELVTWEILDEKNPGCRYDPATQSVLWSDYEGQRQALDVNTGKRLEQ